MRYTRKAPKDITRDDLENFKFELSQARRRERTIIAKIAGIRSFFRFLKRDEVIKDIKTPKKPQSLPRFLTEEEVSRFLMATQRRSAVDHAIYSVLYYAGLRVSEVCRLNRSDVNFQNRTVTVRAGKGKKDGVVQIHKDALAALEYYFPLRPTPNHQEDSDALFISRVRLRITPRYVFDKTKRYAIDAGIQGKKVTPHAFRHSLAATMRRNGASLMDIRDQLRHTDISATVIYAQIENESLRKAYESSVPSATQVFQRKPQLPGDPSYA